MAKLLDPDTGTADSWRHRDAAAISAAYSRYSDLVVQSAEGAHLYTVDGRDVLDFGSGIAVVNLGHRHPAVVAAVHAQVDRVWHTSVTTLNTAAVEAAEALKRISPPGLERVFLCNSGAEAVEGALKLARKATGRSEVISFFGAFHGRTYGALTLTASRAKYHAGMEPLLPGIHHVTYPNRLRMAWPPASAEHAVDVALGELQRLFATTVDPATVAAIFVEPVQGEGGYIAAPPGFLVALRSLCDEHGILLVADEVQSGFARTGRMFAIDHAGVEPDIMCVAKALGNGLPIAAFVATDRVSRAWSPGEHGSTFGGNPVACAAAVAVIEVIERERLAQRASTLGRTVSERAARWRRRHPVLAEVRGPGLMIGLEFLSPDGSPDAEIVEAVRQAALRRDLLVLSCGTDNNVIRLAPPLTIPEDELETGLAVLEAALEEVAR